MICFKRSIPVIGEGGHGMVFTVVDVQTAVFREHAESEGMRPPIPTESGHRIRPKATT
jgi:hypothetical protein